MKSLLEIAIDELSNLLKDEEFLVKELFKGYEWKRLPIKERLKLGTLFLNEVESKANLGIEILGKTSANQQKYRKK